MNTSQPGTPQDLTAPPPAPARKFHRLAVAGALFLGALAIAALAFYATRGQANSLASVGREIHEPKSAAPDFLNQAPRRQRNHEGDGPDPRLAELLRPRPQQWAQSYPPPASPGPDPTRGSSTLDTTDPTTGTPAAGAEPAIGAYRPFPGVRYTQTAPAAAVPAARPSWEAAFGSSLVPTSAATAMNEPRMQQSLFGVPPPPDRPTDLEDALTPNANDVRIPNKATSAVQPGRDDRRALPPDTPVLPAGTVISAILLTAVNTEQPGNVTAQVSSDVWDARGRGSVLIPAGTRLIGSYKNQVSVGDSRVAIVWNRLALGSRTLDLPALPAAAIDGSAGQPGSVNNHSLLVFGRAALLSLISAGAQLSQPRRSRNDLEFSNGQVIAGAAGQELSSAGTEFLKRAVNVAPTITVPAGTNITVLLPADLPLPLGRD